MSDYLIFSDNVVQVYKIFSNYTSTKTQKYAPYMPKLIADLCFSTFMQKFCIIKLKILLENA